MEILLKSFILLSELRSASTSLMFTSECCLREKNATNEGYHMEHKYS